MREYFAPPVKLTESCLNTKTPIQPQQPRNCLARLEDNNVDRIFHSDVKEGQKKYT